MPTSYVEGKQTIANWLGEIQPTRAIDIGPGCGTYNFLVNGIYGSMATDDFDHGLDKDPDGFKDYNGPRCDMWGVEVFYPYVEKYALKQRYKEIIISDIRYFNWSRLNLRFDVCFFGDVLEHLDEYDAKNVFDEAKKWCDNIIVSLPIIHFPQGAVMNNPFEEHLQEDWSYEDVIDFVGTPHKSFKGKAIGTFWYKGETEWNYSQ